MKTNFTDLEKVVLKAIVESAHESGDNGVGNFCFIQGCK